jgi:hypothetical protein
MVFSTFHGARRGNFVVSDETTGNYGSGSPNRFFVVSQLQFYRFNFFTLQLQILQNFIYA